MTTPKPEVPAPTTALPRRAPRPPDLHKGQAGHVAIFAGSRGLSGAAVLSGLGALRGGAGLVRVYCAASVQPIVAVAEPCLMTVPLPEDADGRIALDPAKVELNLDWAHALAIGPGLGQSDAVAALVAALLVSFAGPVVVDADGLNNIAARGAAVWQPRAARATVITPHPGEMARLRVGLGLPQCRGADDNTRLAAAHECAVRAGVTVVLKGHRTVVSTPDATYVNATGNPGMASGGMGDVLTGLLAALLAQGLDAFAAARLGVYCHGLAADRCARDIAPVGYLAREVADALPAALADACRPQIGFR
ncbi:MAG TPA: NAD(P)H-hydrate dehydratase [Phycisphaerae bacterium]|nr:NAD(P)H-hydrate dehydratase [Phycisphaerae bacterium]